MTNAEAISLLRGLEKSLDGYCELNEDGKKAFNKAISALEAQEQLANNSPELDKENGELIRKKAAIEALKEAFNPSITNFVKAKMAIDNLPSALSEKRTEERTETHACDLIDRQTAKGIM